MNKPSGRLKPPLSVWVISLVFLLNSWGNPLRVFAGEGEKIRVVGSTTVLPVVSRAAERFSLIHGGNLTITVNPGGSGVGVNAVSTGRAEIGMVSREISQAEKKRFAKSDLKLHTVGRDAVACVISSEVYGSGVHELSREQIRDIYLGKITNWQAVGGPDRDIVVVDKERHRGTRHVFMAYVFGDPLARAPGARLVTGSNNEEQAKIAQSNAAIGMLSASWINEDVVAVGIREGEDVYYPTPENIRSGRYPIVRNLNLVTRGNPSGRVREFIEFVRSAEGRRIVEESGYSSASVLPKGR